MTKRIIRDVQVFPSAFMRTNLTKRMAWEIRCERPYIIAFCGTQKMATALGRALAKLTEIELVVHKKDGTIKRTKDQSAPR